MSNGRAIPLPAGRADDIAGRLVDAALLLAGTGDVDARSIERLIECAELLLDHRQGWLPRWAAVQVCAIVLDHGVIPLEATYFLGAAEDLLQIHDELTAALLRW